MEHCILLYLLYGALRYIICLSFDWNNLSVDGGSDSGSDELIIIQLHDACKKNSLWAYIFLHSSNEI